MLIPEKSTNIKLAEVEQERARTMMDPTISVRLSLRWLIITGADADHVIRMMFLLHMANIRGISVLLPASTSLLPPTQSRG